MGSSGETAPWCGGDLADDFLDRQAGRWEMVALLGYQG
jgi:hypothetical protein